MLGRLLTWTQDGALFVPPEMMTQEDLIRYLRLDVDERDPVERVRNLMRYQGLPVTRRGRLLLFRKMAVDHGWMCLLAGVMLGGGWGGVPRQTSTERRQHDPSVPGQAF